MSDFYNPRQVRWPQFSLRGLFVVVTLSCIWLGVQVMRIHDRSHRSIDEPGWFGGDGIAWVIAIAGIAGLIALISLIVTSEDQDEWMQAFIISSCWQAVPTVAWLWLTWYGPSALYTVVEGLTLIGVPATSGFFHRSWKVAAISLALPLILYGLMMAALIVIMGNGR